MKLRVWTDGQVVEATMFRLDQPYIMQRIHTLGYKPYNVARHVALLREDAMRVFGFASLCSAADAERIITKLLELSRVSRQLSCPVAMRIDACGALSFEVETPLYVGGVSLRAKRFTGIDIAMNAPDTMCQSSVSVAVDAMMDAVVEKRGGDISVWTDADGCVISLPWRPMFAIFNGNLYTPCQHDTV